MARRLKDRASGQHGFTLIEVLMSALVVTLIAGGVAAGLMANMRATGDQHRRTDAQALAEQDQERLKGLSPEQLDNLSQTYTTTFDKYKFTVTSQAWYLSSTNGQACSTSGGASATDFKTISTVAWTNASGVNTTLATDESVISPPEGGGLLAQFHDQTTSPLSGVALSASGPDSDAATSDSNGCVILSALPTGSYNLTFTDTGYVDPNGNASPVSATANVASTGFAAPSDGNPVELGVGGGITGQFKTAYNGTNYAAQSDGLSWLSPGGGGIPMASYRDNATALAGSINTTVASGTASSPGGLFPFVSSLNPVSYTNNYQVWAGKCLQEQPPAGVNMFSVSPGSSNTQPILEPALVLTTTYKAQSGTVTNVNPAHVRATFNSTSGTSCGPDDWGPLTAATVAPTPLPTGQNLYGIPFTTSATTGSNASSSGQTGKVTVCADYTTGGKTYQNSVTFTDDSYTSTTSQSIQIPYAATAPGACT